VPDSSDNSNDGTLIGAETLGTGKINKALSLDDVDSCYVDLPDTIPVNQH
jgi:hypothetical protein